jgi:predicted Zn-dependent protease with MMP-like domain
MSRPLTDAQVEQLLDTAEEALDGGRPEEAIAPCERVLKARPEHVDATLILAEAWRDQGDHDQAEACYLRVLAIDNRNPTVWASLGHLQFHEFRFDEARSSAQRGIRLDPTSPESYWTRGLVRERLGDEDGAARDFHRAHRFDPLRYPLPVVLDDATIEAVVEETLHTLHPVVRAYLRKVAILVEEFPDEGLCRGFQPAAWPDELLGYFSGPSLLDREVGLPWSNLPTAIVLFRKNLERIASDRQRVVDELRITVFHEVGHFLGLDEDDLEARGLD